MSIKYFRHTKFKQSIQKWTKIKYFYKKWATLAHLRGVKTISERVVHGGVVVNVAIAVVLVVRNLQGIWIIVAMTKSLHRIQWRWLQSLPVMKPIVSIFFFHNSILSMSTVEKNVVFCLMHQVQPIVNSSIE